MRRGNRISSLMFSGFFLAFLVFFVMNVLRMTSGNTSSLPDPVRAKASVIERQKENTARSETINGTTTPRTTTVYRLIVEYQDGDTTRQGTYNVTEDVYAKYEEGSILDMYYYPGTSLSGYGTPRTSSFGRSTSSFGNMQQIIAIFMLAVAGFMALGVMRTIFIPAITGRSLRAFPRPSSPRNTRTQRGSFGSPSSPRPSTSTLDIQPRSDPPPSPSSSPTVTDRQKPIVSPITSPFASPTAADLEDRFGPRTPRRLPPTSHPGLQERFGAPPPKDED